MDKEDKDAIVASRKDRDEFAFLYEKYVDKIFNYFWYRVGHDRDVAEDLTQEVFVRAYKHLDKFQIRKTSYASYLLTIAHNVLVNYYRSPKPISIESTGVDVPEEIWSDIETKDNLRSMWRAIQHLPSNERDMLYLKYQKGYKVKDIAKIVGKSENAVKLTLSRARKKLAAHPYLKGIAGFTDTKRKKKRARYKDS
tara:strand:- start:274 stop:861 length:588 start_codon:yes stop_codon:yes gene_type:complete